LPENLDLPHQYNHITFEFAAAEPSKPYLVKYQYILENYDKDWSAITNNTTAAFGNIYEGTYTFKVRAQSPDGIWSDPVSYTFKVSPPIYRTWWAYSLYAIVGFYLLYGLLRWRTASLRKKNEMLEQTIQQRTIEVVKQKDEAEKQRAEAEKQRAEAEKQKILVEEKNKSITDSINYAKRIQRALLQEEEYVSMHLPEHFILFKPKDIVSGDFYWGIEKDEYFYMAAVDCTGHGVPGGFMSMLGLAFLNELTAGSAILTPAEILDELRNKILKEFKQTGTDADTKDGMDISLMRMNLRTKEIQWSGANNALYMVGNDFKEVPPDKQPIGHYPLMKPFSNHTIEVEQGSTLYLFSDGYADQFGGPNGKKFRYSELKGLLTAIHDKSMREQKKILDATFETWKGNLEQVDDVLVIGIRV
jgi:serine phosphatase RsbU (regulator of sigma subunit)